MPVLSVDLMDAIQEVAHVENALIDGYAPPGGQDIGSHARTAIRKAADDLGIDPQALRRRVGMANCVGAHARRFKLAVDWDVYRPTERFSHITDEQAMEAIRAYERTGSHRRAAEVLNISPEAVRRRILRASERGLIGYKPVMHGFKVTRSSTTLDAHGNVRAQHVQQKPDVGDEFEVPLGQTIKGVSALVDAEGRIVNQWVKTREETATADLVAALKTAFSEYDGHAKLIPPPKVADADLLSVYPIADQHNGLLAWGKETGENYDLKIGAARLRSCMSRLVTQSPPSAHAIIVNLGDYSHLDDSKNVTPSSGHTLDVDSRYFKILTAGVKLMQDCIELTLQRHQHVTVRNIPGNHDPHASIALTVALSAFYSANPRVTVDDTPGDWFFHRFGATLMAATHGHKAKADRMAMTMAVRCREEWGATRYHWCLSGHIHHEVTKEVGDVRCESFQSLAANDAYSAGAGFVAGKSLVSITLHREDGEIGRHRVNVPPPPSPIKTPRKSAKKSVRRCKR